MHSNEQSDLKPGLLASESGAAMEPFMKINMCNEAWQQTKRRQNK